MALIIHRRAFLAMAFPTYRFVPIALACLLLASCGKNAEPADANAAPGSASLAVTLAGAEQRSIERSVAASGPVTAWEEMQLGVELNGLRVTALHVDVGQHVRKGDVLLEIDHQTLDSDLRQAQASAAEAAAGVKLAEVNLWRGQEMAKSQLISASALDNLRAALVQAQARAATTAAQRDGVRMRRDFAALRAPDDGVISKRMVQPGQVVMAGAELLRMIRRGRLEWRPELAEADLAKVAVGATVVVRDATGRSVSGLVRAVSPGVDTATRTGTIYADLPQPGALKAGTFVEGRIVTSVSTGVLVPTAAVVTRDGYAYVFTVDAQNTAHRVRVRVGSAQDGQIEILDGLKPGEAVVATGAGFLGDGDKVRVVAAANASTAGAANAGATP
jgi:RND family efflux transporter MFP subunit